MIHMLRSEFLPYSSPLIAEDEINEVTDTLRSSWLSRGPKTAEFERQFADYVGASHAIAMNSCTAALHVALIARGIGPGDEVITSPLTFAATANTIIHCGAKPVFVDVDAETGNIDPSGIEEKITNKTKAIVPVHYAGQACDMDRIIGIARKYGLFVSEDAAHAIYTTYKGRMIGGIGDATSFSFYATKNLCTGEGGMLTTNDDSIAEKARVISLHGMSKNAWNRYDKNGSWYYEILYPGFKYNMTDIQASLGIQQLKKLEHMQKAREAYAKRYNEAFAGVPGIITPKEIPGNRHSWHLYVIQLDGNQIRIGRDRLIEELTKRNIGTSVHFIPVHLHPYYQERYGYKKGAYPVAEHMYERMVSLPLYPKMRPEDIDRVVDAVTGIVRENR
ncbi:putative aminotransferase [Methanocella paludicola SANAE]|uniref:Aminotransferase n=2 Tax=Methanocella TaxID=570266 RepID=D1YWM4_METPS|nr:putative aminotransferase [Methanocella paludicola SANAE]